MATTRFGARQKCFRTKELVSLYWQTFFYPIKEGGNKALAKTFVLR